MPPKIALDSDGNHLYEGKPWVPKDLAATLNGKSAAKCAWRQQFRAVVVEEGPQAGICMLQCNDCKGLCSASNPATSAKQHEKSCKGAPKGSKRVVEDIEGELCESPSKHTRSKGASATPAGGQTGIKEFCATPKQQQEAIKDLALHIFTKNSPFQHADCAYLKRSCGITTNKFEVWLQY